MDIVTIASDTDTLETITYMDWGEYILPTLDADKSAFIAYSEIIDPSEDNVPYPFTFLIGTDGVITYYHTASMAAELAAAIEAVL